MRRIERSQWGGVKNRNGNTSWYSENGDEIFSVRCDTVITVADWSQGAGDTIALSYGTAGATTVTLTEGVDFDAATSNTITGDNIAAAINALGTKWYATNNAGVVTIIGGVYDIVSGDENAWTVYNNKVTIGADDLTVENLTVEGLARFTATGYAIDVDITGDMEVDGKFTVGGAGAISLTSTDTTISLSAAGELDLTSAALVDLNAGANLDVDVTGTVDILASGAFSIDGTGASNVTATTGGLTLAAATSGTLWLDGDALVDLDAGANLDIDVVGTFDMLSSGAFSIDGTGASNVTATAGNLTVATAGASGNLLLGSIGETDITVGNLLDVNVTAGGMDVDVTAGDITIDAAAGGISIDGTGAMNFTSSADSISIISGTAGGLATSILLQTPAGGGATVDAGTGGLYLQSDGTVELTGIAVFPMNISGGHITVSSLDNVADAILISTNVGAAETINLTNTQGTGADAIELTATAGGIDVNATVGGVTIDAGTAISLDAASGSNLTVTANSAGAEVLTLEITNAGAGTGAIDINADDAITIDSTVAGVSIDGVTASNFTVTGAADLTLQSTAGSIIIDGGEVAADAIDINAASGGLDIDVGLGADINAGTTVDITGGTGVEVNATTGDAELNAVAGSVSISAGEAVTDAVSINASLGGVNIDIAQGRYSVNVNGRIESSSPVFYDEFWRRIMAREWVERTNTGAGGVINGAPSTDLNGYVRFTTGAAGGPDELSYDFSDIFNFDSTLRPTYEIKMALGQVADADTNVYVGLIDAAGAYDGTAGDGILISYNQGVNGDFWYCRVFNGGASTDIVSTVAGGVTLRKFRVEYVSDTEVEFFIDGVSHGTANANVPAGAAMQPVLAVISDAAATKSADFGHVKIWQDDS